MGLACHCDVSAQRGVWNRVSAQNETKQNPFEGMVHRTVVYIILYTTYSHLGLWFLLLEAKF